MGGRARVYVDLYNLHGAPSADGWRPIGDSDPAAAELQLLRELVAQRVTLEGRVAVTVQKLRAAGASWTVIGDVLGVTRSAAQKRYGADQLL
ncbi:MAG TPA: hypothetical protein VGC04_11205 [Cellulomonas sp.]